MTNKRKYQFILVIISIIVLNLFLYKEVGEGNQKVVSINKNTYEDQLFKIIQDWRVENGKDKYKYSQILCTVAKKRVEQIKMNWSHDGFKQALNDIREVTNYKIIGENLSKDFIDPKLVLPAWLNSKLHRDNLEKDYQYSCIQCSGTYCVHLFGMK
jgi:uncharacterized protein YkwD